MASQTGRFRSFLDGLVEPQPTDQSVRTTLSRVADQENETTAQAPAIPLRRQIDNYIALTKPGILTLLVATELAAMMVAAAGLPPFRIVVAGLLGGLLAAAGANTLNCYIDRDIDRKMSRTQHRATATGEITPRNALIYGLTLNALAVLILGLGTNWFAAGLAALDHGARVSVAGLVLLRQRPAGGA